MKNIINKPFNYHRALEILSKMKKVGIKTQACFVVGMPGELLRHRIESLVYMIKLCYRGVDEVACYIITPVPGAKIFSDEKLSGYKSLSECSHSPTWRSDFFQLYMYRVIFYSLFILIKIIFYPISSISLFLRIFTKNFETKMEMSIFKKLKLIRLSLFAPKV